MAATVPICVYDACTGLSLSNVTIHVVASCGAETTTVISGCDLVPIPACPEEIAGEPTTWTWTYSKTGYQNYVTTNAGEGGDIYLTPVGGCSGEEPDCDLPAVTALTLQEDGDGIAPRGVLTYDRTPTLAWEWDAAVTARRYRWRLTPSPSGALLASGYVLAEQATLGVLAPDSYTFWVRGEAEDTCTSAGESSLGFTVEALVPEIPISVPDDREIEPLDPLPPSLLRYLPSWHVAFGTAETPISGSLFYRFMQPQVEEYSRFRRGREQVLREAAVQEVPGGQPRLAWYLHTRLDPRDQFAVQVRVAGATGEVRRAESEYDFLSAHDPVYLVDAQGQMALRNLSSRRQTLSPTSGAYLFTDESDGLVRDADVTFLYGDRWYRVPVESRGLNTRDGELLLPSRFTGAIEFRYLSRTYQDQLDVKVGEESWARPIRFDIWNRFDELGLLAGFHPESGGRRPDEDNLAFRKRIRARFLSGPGTTAAAVERRVAEDLALVELLAWDGSATLNLAASGYLGVQEVYVRGVPELESRYEELLPTGAAGEYTASKTDWLPGYLLAIDGRPVTALTYPDLALSGKVVSLGRAVTGETIAAHFRYRNYELTRTARGTITTVTPVTGNLEPGDYEVLLVRGARAHTLDSDTFREEELLDAAGRPNGYFRQLRPRLLEGSPVHAGRSTWARAHWLEDEDQPAVTYLPVIFDGGSV